MPDDPELPLSGLDAERPLAPELRARLESAMLAAVAGGLPVPADEEALDAPRPLPEVVRTRLETALLAEAAAPTAGAEVAGVVTSLAGRRSRKVVAAWSAVAAVLLMVVAVAGLVSRGNPGSQNLAAGGPTTTTAGTPASVPSDAGVTAETTPPAPATATTRATKPVRPGPSTTGVPAGAGTTTTGRAPPGGTTPSSPTTTTPVSPGAGQPATTDPGPAPPFYNSAPNGDAASPAPAMSSQPSGAAPNQGSQGAQPQKSTAPPPSGPPLRVGIVTGDAAQEAGFRAYVDQLNRSGGVRQHSVELVPVSAASPAAGTIATVNLGSQPVAGPGGAPGWATGPLLETLTATENLLTGNGAVFSFASPPERQGHLAADALFPSAVTSKPPPNAVIYAASSGPLSDVVPAAMEAVLRQRGLKVTVVTYDPAQKRTGLVAGADAALLSLDPAAARAWVTQAKGAGYRPAMGLAGIYSLADDTLAPDLPDGTRVISPYVVPGGDEGQAIRSIPEGSSAPVLHGWVTAKALAAAVWRTGADTPAEMQSALEGLAGWSPGLAPAYETRPGTRSRTPEGVLFQVQSGAYVAQGGFRRDSF
ncbi:MAG: Periplasmic binding protein [Actinomycetota bacterium]|nr:Periplasmic binding protein [Actinomycetota bacterium]